MKARAYVMIDTTAFQYLTNEELGKGVFKVTGRNLSTSTLNSTSCTG